MTNYTLNADEIKAILNRLNLDRAVTGNSSMDSAMKKLEYQLMQRTA